MLYRQKKDTYIRNYGEIGYITSTGLFNDRVVNGSGAVFLSALSREPQTIEALVDRILESFIDADRDNLTKDAIEFFNILVDDGFLVKGDTVDDLDSNDQGFTYRAIEPKTIRKDFSPVVSRSDTDTQTSLDSFFRTDPRLTSFQIELTSRCNERCVHCYIPHDLKIYDIEPALYYSVLDQLSKMGVLSITLSGGEPMLHPRFVEFLRAAKKYDFYVNILSNLTLLNDETLEAIKEGNVSSVQVSLYSMIPEHHDAITTIKGSFEKTKNAILKLIENDIPLHISCPTMKGNKDDYPGVMEWCKQHKIRCQTDYIMMAEFNGDTENLANRLSIEETGRVIRGIVENDEEYQSVVLYPDFEQNCKYFCHDPERRLCGVGFSSCCMVANGNVYPCPGWQQYVIGNLYEQSLQDIWDNSEKIKYLRGVKFKDLGEGQCAKCENASFCSPCMVRNANESSTGNPLEINKHFCDVARINKDIVLEWRKAHLKK